MDMKNILNIFDNVASRPVQGANDMKRFISVVRENGPMNLDLEKEPVDTANPMPAENPEDAVLLDIPLLIRLLEYAREDANSDMDLHTIAEKLIGLSKDGQPLSMSDYDAIVGDSSTEMEPADSMSALEKHPYGEGLTFSDYVNLAESAKRFK
jgi:hypothetical protein